MAANPEIGAPLFEALIDPLDPEFRADPYSRYQQLRSQDPVHWSPMTSRASGGFWVITRYADCLSLLEDLRLGMTCSDGQAPPELRRGAAARISPQLLVFDDRPRHTRLRELLAEAVETLRPRVHAIASELLCAIEGRGRMDLMADFASQVPVQVICEVLGAPTADRPRFQEWTADFPRIFEPGLQTPEALARCDESVGALVDYLEDLIRRRQSCPGDDILSRLVRAEAAGGRLGQQELLAAAIQLLIAGTETTAGLIGNGALALLQHPDQLARLRSDPDLARGAVEECLRFDSPVQITGRIAQEEIELRGVRIERDQRLAIVLASANRDTDAFDYPTHFDITRTGPANLSFGTRANRCLGAPLARMQAQIALGALVRRLPRLALATEKPERRPSLLFRTLESLPVTF
jgi:cytochrome P450